MRRLVFATVAAFALGISLTWIVVPILWPYDYQGPYNFYPRPTPDANQTHVQQLTSAGWEPYRVQSSQSAGETVYLRRHRPL